MITLSNLLHKYHAAVNIIELFAKETFNGIRLAFSNPHHRLILNGWFDLCGNKVNNNNWGDDINYYFLKDVTNLNIYNISNCKFHKKYENILAIGSIIEAFTTPNSIIWGSGIMYNDINRRFPHPKRVAAVRGKLTRDFLIQQGIDCPTIYGDPALLLSYHYRPTIQKRYKYGIIPHYIDLPNIDQELITQILGSNVSIIDMQNYTNWTDIIDQILQCENIISSSLHGLIISDTYGIPNVWAKFSEKIGGGEFKYLDYFSGVQRKTIAPLVVDNTVSATDIRQMISQWQPIAYNPIPLLNSCPFNIHLKYDPRNQHNCASV